MKFLLGRRFTFKRYEKQTKKVPSTFFILLFYIPVLHLAGTLVDLDPYFGCSPWTGQTVISVSLWISPFENNPYHCVLFQNFAISLFKFQIYY